MSREVDTAVSLSYLHTIGWGIRLMFTLTKHKKQQCERKTSGPRTDEDEPAVPLEPVEHTLPRFHVNVPLASRSDSAADDEIGPVLSAPVSPLTVRDSPPAYEDEEVGVIISDKKQKFGGAS